MNTIVLERERHKHPRLPLTAMPSTLKHKHECLYWSSQMLLIHLVKTATEPSASRSPTCSRRKGAGLRLPFNGCI